MNEENYEKIRAIFSENGLNESIVVIKAKDDININISCEDDYVDIDFTGSKSLPELTVKIVDAGVEGIRLRKNAGRIKLKSFPDIPFLYKWIEGFGSVADSLLEDYINDEDLEE